MLHETREIRIQKQQKKLLNQNVHLTRKLIYTEFIFGSLRKVITK